MPDKEGSDEKSTKSVVSKKQKQMMGEEGYDIARDMGRVRPSKDKKDATTMPVSDEVKKTQKVNKGSSALDIIKKKYKGQIMDVKKEELDLTQVAEALGGYIVEAPSKEEEQQNKADQTKREKIQKRFSDQQSADASRRRTQGAGDRKDLGSGKGSERVTTGREPKKISGIDTKGTGRETLDKGVIKGIETETDREQTITRPTADRSRRSAREYDSISKMMRKDAARERRAEKLQDPKFRASETLRKAKPTDIKGGPSVKRGDPVPQEVRKIKNAAADIDRDAPYQRNTFKGFRDKVKTVTPDKVIPPKGDPLKVNQPQEGPTIDVEKLPFPAKRRKSTFTLPAFATRKGESGGPLPVSMRNRRVRQDRSIVKAEPSEIEKLKPSQKGVQQGGAIVKTQPSEIEKLKPMKKGNIIVRTKVKTGTQDPGIDPEVTTDNPRTRTRTQTGTETAINNIRRFRRGPRGGGGGTDGPGFGKRFGDFMKFTRDNPVASLIGFDAAKSVGKKALDVLNPKNFGLRGGRVGRRSAKQ